MVQNHMLQLLCLVAMEAPPSAEAESVRDEKLKVLRALSPIDASNAAQVTVRGQYRAGASRGGAVEGYLEELDNGGSNTETFVAIKAEIENWRWAGVPFYLRTGKRMAEAGLGNRHQLQADSALDLRQKRRPCDRQPVGHPAAAGEGVKQWIMIKDPGPGGMRLRHVPLDMSFAESFGVRNPDAYERLLMDVIRCNQTLFMRRDEVRGGMEVGRSDPRRLGGKPSTRSRLHRRHLRPDPGHRADRTGRPHLARESLSVMAEPQLTEFANGEVAGRGLGGKGCRGSR